MSTFLFIDTSGPDAFIGISQNEQIIATRQNSISNTHAEFVQAGIEELCKSVNLSLNTIDAISVTMGPEAILDLGLDLQVPRASLLP